jgi:SulP family sulfate permease
VTDELRADFARSALGTTIGGGIAAAVITISYGVSLAALVFRGELAVGVADGVGIALFATVALGLAATLTSSIPGVVPSVGGKSAAILAVAAASLVGDVDADALVPTVIAMSVTATVAIGVACLLLARFQLGALVRYIPYPVVGGFMASAGVLTGLGGWELLARDRSFGDLGGGDSIGLWLPGAAVALGVLIAMHQRIHRLVLPCLLLASGVLLHVGFAIGGVARESAAAKGWLLVDRVTEASWRPDRIAILADADWLAVFEHTGALVTIVVLVITSVLLYAHGLELATDREVDLHRDLRGMGWGSLLGAVGGGMPAYTNIEGSMLSVRIGGPRRGAALVATAMAGAHPRVHRRPPARGADRARGRAVARHRHGRGGAVDVGSTAPARPVRGGDRPRDRRRRGAPRVRAGHRVRDRRHGGAVRGAVQPRERGQQGALGRRRHQQRRPHARGASRARPAR